MVFLFIGVGILLWFVFGAILSRAYNRAYVRAANSEIWLHIANSVGVFDPVLKFEERFVNIRGAMVWDVLAYIAIVIITAIFKYSTITNTAHFLYIFVFLYHIWVYCEKRGRYNKQIAGAADSQEFLKRTTQPILSSFNKQLVFQCLLFALAFVSRFYYSV